MSNFLLILLIFVVGWRLPEIVKERYWYPAGKKGTLLRFKECVKTLKLDEARDIALSFDDPFRKRMLKEAWSKFKKERGPVVTYETLFFWLDEIKRDLREEIAPGVYKQYGIKLIKTSIHNFDKVDWKVIESINYKLSCSELKRLAINGDKKAINILDQT